MVGSLDLFDALVYVAIVAGIHAALFRSAFWAEVGLVRLCRRRLTSGPHEKLEQLASLRSIVASGKTTRPAAGPVRRMEVVPLSPADLADAARRMRELLRETRWVRLREYAATCDLCQRAWIGAGLAWAGMEMTLVGGLMAAVGAAWAIGQVEAYTRAGASCKGR